MICAGWRDQYAFHHGTRSGFVFRGDVGPENADTDIQGDGTGCGLDRRMVHHFIGVHVRYTSPYAETRQLLRGSNTITCPLCHAIESTRK